MRPARPFALIVGATLSLTGLPAAADPGVGLICPPVSFANATNLAPNPSVETVGPFGQTSICAEPCTIEKGSAAAAWTMHSDNDDHFIATQLVSPSTVPFGTDPTKGRRMLFVNAGAEEGGIFRRQRSPSKLMFQAWVFVEAGEVHLGVNAQSTGPISVSTKQNQWEVLRVCTDGTVPTGFFYIYNQDPSGGRFYVDRLEIRRIP